MHADRIKEWDEKARAKIIYQQDGYDGVADLWRSYADNVLRDEPWTGDCDDLTSTILDLLGRDGVALSDRWRLLVGANGSSETNHMVGAARDDDGVIWIVGDTFGPCYRAGTGEWPHHTPILYNALNETGFKGQNPTWRDGAPWL